MLNPGTRQALIGRLRLLQQQVSPVLGSPDESNIQNMAWIIDVLVDDLLARDDQERPVANAVAAGATRPASSSPLVS